MGFLSHIRKRSEKTVGFQKGGGDWTTKQVSNDQQTPSKRLLEPSLGAEFQTGSSSTRGNGHIGSEFPSVIVTGDIVCVDFKVGKYVLDSGGVQPERDHHGIASTTQIAG